MPNDELKLKPCPFCGGKAQLVVVPGYFKQGLSSSGWLVKCLNGCCNQMPYSSDHGAIEAWNRRAKEPVRHGYWYFRGGRPCCSVCNTKALWKDEGGTGGFSHEYIGAKSKWCPECGAKMDKEADDA